MGLFDFFKKGVEKPVEKKPANTTRTTHPPATGGPSGTQRPSTDSSRPQTSNREYVIKSGDSLSKIAKQFYGNAADWQKIYQANKSVIKDPNLIHPGQKIIIP
jgi:nucleoid-associated protein YgaU